MRFFVDVDGTLTYKQCSRSIDKVPLRSDVINLVKKLITEGHEVIIWTGNTGYAKRVAKTLGIDAIACVGKPDVIVDNEQHRFGKKLRRRVITPEQFIEKYSKKEETNEKNEKN
jgi:hydroxymethylpyrimidine pyrophosphatase-like HAD family hydrolase